MKTRLDVLCEVHGQQGGTIHDFNKQYESDLLSISNKEFFKLIYGIQLKRSKQSVPEAYAWDMNQLPVVLERMCQAIDKKSFSKDGAAFKLTCKVIGIPYTYKAIFSYLDSHA